MKNNALWVCSQSSTCHFSCYEKQSDKDLYIGGVKAFLNTWQSNPLCCISKDGEHNYAKIKVVKDINKKNYGRPFFVCSKGFDPCSYFEWGDQKIPETPLCEHQQSSQMFTVKKKGQIKTESSSVAVNETPKNAASFSNGSKTWKKRKTPWHTIKSKHLLRNVRLSKNIKEKNYLLLNIF